MRIHSTKDAVTKQFQKGMCLSGFILNKRQGLMYVPYSKRKIVAECVRFAYNKFCPMRLTSVDGMQFTKFKLIVEMDEKKSYTYLKKDKLVGGKFCLVVPSLFNPPNGQFESQFVIITNSWKVVNKSGKIGSLNMFQYR